MSITNVKKYSSHNICLNLCSSCNLNCSWCYKQAIQELPLSFEKFELFYERVISQNIKTVTLIGGEPTIHPDFIRIMKLLKNQQVFLNTNGLMFSDEKFLQLCIENDKTSSLKSVSVSLKGYDDESFLYTTGVCEFDRLCQAVSNLKSTDIHTIYSYTYDENMTEQRRKCFASFLIKYKIDTIVINDVRPFYKMDKDNVDNTIVRPGLTAGLEKLIWYLEKVGIVAYIRLNHPLCEYDSGFINYLITNHRLVSQCAVKTSGGFFFSTSLELIPCNELYSVVLGKFDEDFNSFEELEQLWNMSHIRSFYQELSGYPDRKCKECNLWRICGGGCILHWLK